MIRLGIDLRHVPTDGSAGAGVVHASNELADAMCAFAAEYGMEIVEFRGKTRAWTLARRVRAAGIDAMFCASGAVPPFLPRPAFPWVHDVAIFGHPEWFPQSRWKRFVTTQLFLRGVRRAPHVFVVSEDTRSELIRLTGLPPDRISVTYQGIKPIAAGERKPYALILGSVNPRKNIGFVKALWSRVQATVPAAELVIAGEPHRRFDDAERDALVRHASILLLPSLHEGFGRTALEAMSCGVPVIASNRGAIPEVVGDAGILLDPADSIGWIRTIRDGFEGRLDGKKGMVRAALFSWEKTARIILAKIKEYC